MEEKIRHCISNYLNRFVDSRYDGSFKELPSGLLCIEISVRRLLELSGYEVRSIVISNNVWEFPSTLGDFHYLECKVQVVEPDGVVAEVPLLPCRVGSEEQWLKWMCDIPVKDVGIRFTKNKKGVFFAPEWGSAFDEDGWGELEGEWIYWLKMVRADADAWWAEEGTPEPEPSHFRDDDYSWASIMDAYEGDYDAWVCRNS